MISRMYKPVIIDGFEVDLQLEVRGHLSADVRRPVMHAMLEVRNATWGHIIRRVELAMKDEALNYFPRLGGWRPWTWI